MKAVNERPYVLLSAAMSADGYLDDAASQRLVLSDAADLDRVDGLRASCDAILVGAQTIRADNPRLLIRSPQRRADRLAHGLPEHPLKVTVTASGRLDPDCQFFTTADRPPLVYLAAAAAGRLPAEVAAVATVVPVPVVKSGGTAGRADLSWILGDLAARGVTRLLIEGGGTVLGQALSGGLADEFWLAVAPLLVGDPLAPRLVPAAVPGRMRLAEVAQVGDMAVLKYLPGRN